MATRRKNEWLEADASEDGDEDEDAGYDSDLAESRAKSIVNRSIKRRKVDYSDSEDEQTDEADDEAHPAEAQLKTLTSTITNVKPDAEVASPTTKTDPDTDTDANANPTKTRKTLPPPLPPKTKLAKKLEKSQRKTKKTGVIYISRIPPFMKPSTLKTLLTPSAPSGLRRIFLTPETPTAHTTRVRQGGNKKRNFSDGWVEFASKREAKIACETLNTRIIGGKKGGYYHDDVWNLKYLRGFKWRHLTEEVANRNAERGARLRAEGWKERREVREYLRNVDRAKMLDGMEKKKALKEERGGDTKGGAGAEAGAVGVTVGRNVDNRRQEKREFRQVEVMSRAKRELAVSEQPDQVKRVLNSIF